MAWIESHQELGRHPKTKKFARLAGVSVPTAVGHLHFLWWWALDYVQNGDLTKYAAEDIADAVMWEGDAELLVDALKQSGFLDADNKSLTIHDWNDYAGKLLGRRAADRERKRGSTRNTVEHQQNSIGVPSEAQWKARVQNPTEQNSTEQNNTNPTEKDAGAAKKPRRSKTKQGTNDKTQFADFVSMTNAEHLALVTKLGEQGASRCIEILDNYKGANGKTYVSDYRAILGWVTKRYNEENSMKNNAKGFATSKNDIAKNYNSEPDFLGR